MSKTRYYAVVASTLDGFIARFPGQISTDWTSKEDKEHLHKMEEEADVLLLASKSYRLAEERLSKFNSIVLTRKVNGIEKKNDLLTFLNPEKADFKKYVEEKGYKNICVLGGRAAYNFVLENNLLDDIYLTIEPVVFGEGITIFNKEVELKRFKLESVKNLNTKGTLLLHYSKQ